MRPKKTEEDIKILENIGNNLATIRKNNRISRKELAQMLKVNEMSVGSYERGEKIPSIDKLIRIADYFGVSLDALIRGKVDTTDKIIITEKGDDLVFHLPAARRGLFVSTAPVLSQIFNEVIQKAEKLAPTDKNINVTYSVDMNVSGDESQIQN